MSLADCIKKLKISPEREAEIREFTSVSDEAGGLQKYIDSLGNDLESVRTQLTDQGFDVPAPERAEVEGGQVSLGLPRGEKIDVELDIPVRVVSDGGEEIAETITVRDLLDDIAEDDKLIEQIGACKL